MAADFDDEANLARSIVYRLSCHYSWAPPPPQMHKFDRQSKVAARA
jgi:hypothetical protein